MNIYVAATLFAVLILLYWVISEVFTVLFRLVGLPEEKARFQVVSLLTGTGFTTRESEMVLSTRSPRRLARITMLFGYIFNITFVSAVINVFVSMGLRTLSGSLYSMLIPAAAVAAVFVLSRTRRFRDWLDQKIEHAAARIARDKTSNSVTRVDEFGPLTIAQVKLKTIPEPVRNRMLAQMDLKTKRNILVIMVKHPDGVHENPTARTCFRNGDRITVCGDFRTICEVFEAKERFGDD